MRKLMVMLSLLAAFLLVVSCAPPADGESGALAGEAVARAGTNIELVRVLTQSPSINVGEHTEIVSTCPPKTKFVTGECDYRISQGNILDDTQIGFNMVGQYYTISRDEQGNPIPKTEHYRCKGLFRETNGIPQEGVRAFVETTAVCARRI